MNACEWLYLIETGQEAVWGHEAVALAQVARSGVPVLPAFVISREAVGAFFLQSDLKKAIMKVAKEAPMQKPQELAGYARDIRNHILQAPFPHELRTVYLAFLQQLEDQVLQKPGTGLRLTFTELSGHPHAHHLTKVVKTAKDGEVLIRQLLALSFTDEQLHDRYRNDKAIVHGAHAVLVQYSQEGEYSGTAFCYDFDKHDDSTIVIRAHFHEQAKKARFTPTDEYKVDRSTLLMLSRTLATHHWAEKKSGQHHTPKHPGKTQPILSEDQVLYLARLVKRAQALFDEPFCFHWGFSHNQLFVTRIEPFGEEIEAAQRRATDGERQGPQPILLGLPGNLGVAHGPLCIIKSKTDQTKLKDGDIAVLELAAEGDHAWLAGAAGIICETGHRASFEAHLAKQLAIPAVIATGSALAVLANGQTITVDGTHGALYAGIVRTTTPPTHVSTLPVTGTKILATVLDPQQVTREQLAHADGIGLLRSEFILRMLGVHPQDILRKRLHNEYVDILAEGIESAVRAVYPKQVTYQLHDMHTAHMLGWRERHQDRHEPNPTLGYRGTKRLLNEPEVLDLELQALTKIAAQGITNLSIMLPMVRSLDEVAEMAALLEKAGLTAELWIKCETPALAIRAEDLSRLPIHGVCFDVPALSTLIVGVDRENYQIGHQLDQADEAVCQALEYGIATCRAHGITTTIVAEMETLRPEVIQVAVEAGVSGICVAPDEIEEMHGLVASIEQRMLLDHLLREAEPVEG